MKLTATAVLCLSLLLVHLHFSLAGKTGSLLKKILKKPPKTKTNLDSKTKDSILTKAKQPQYNQGGYPRQPAGGYPQNPGRPGGYLNQGGYGGSYGSYGNYPGSYINYNPNNRILSPHYGGSFGYGGHGGGGGSPFSHSVQAMGYVPSDKSRGFGRTAVMAAAGGAMAGMALGYGLGRFPHPNFHFHSPQEEYFYNYYMYRKYGVKSTDSKDYSRDYKYSQSPETFDSYMASCMKRADLLPDSNRKSENRPVVTTSKTSTTTTVKAMTTSAQVTGSGSNTNNNTVAVNLSSTTPSTSHPMNKSEVNPAPPTASPILQKDDDDDTVSIVEIGYPELIRQIKVKRCTELYIVYSEKYLKKKTSTSSGVHGLEMSMRGLLTVLISSMLMLLNSNMLMLLH